MTPQDSDSKTTQPVPLEKSSLLAAQAGVMRALLEARDLEEASPRVLDALGSSLGFSGAIFWRVAERNNRLLCVATWQREDAGLNDLLTATCGWAYSLGEGIPGSVWASGSAEWIPDLAGDGRCLPRRYDALDGRRLGSYLLPVGSDARIEGVLELLTWSQTAPPREVSLTLTTIGFQLAQFIMQRRRERQLVEVTEQGRRRSELLADAIPQMVWTARADGRPDYYNARCVQYLGRSLEELLYAGLRGSLHPKDWEAASEVWTRALEAGDVFEHEFRLRRASDGMYRWHLSRAAPVRNAHREIIQWIGTITDIDDQKKVSERNEFLADVGTLLGSSLDYKVTLERIAQLVVPRLADWCTVHLLNEQGVVEPLAVTHVDPARIRWAVELSKLYPPNPDTPTGAYHVIRTGEAELYPTIPEAVLVATAQSPEELAILRKLGLKSGMVVPLKVRNHAIGAITFISAESDRCYGQDDLRLAQELAARAAAAVDNARLFQEAQEAVRIRDDFLSVASHELKTPLTPLHLHLEALRRDGGEKAKMSPTLASKLDNISRQVGRLEKLVDSMLDISRITSRRLSLHAEPLDISGLAEDVISRFQPEAARWDSCIRAEIEPGIHGTLDAARVEQILNNLITNAFKFGRGKPVEVKVCGQGSRVRLTVRDYGIGIAPEDQARIFERFERAVTTRHYGGLGLGLWIVRQVVEKLGGQISVRSVVGEGSTFDVIFPRNADSETFNVPMPKPRPEVN